MKYEYSIYNYNSEEIELFLKPKELIWLALICKFEARVGMEETNRTAEVSDELYNRVLINRKIKLKC